MHRELAPAGAEGRRMSVKYACRIPMQTTLSRPGYSPSIGVPNWDKVVSNVRFFGSRPYRSRPAILGYGFSTPLHRMKQVLRTGSAHTGSYDICRHTIESQHALRLRPSEGSSVNIWFRSFPRKCSPNDALLGQRNWMWKELHRWAFA